MQLRISIAGRKSEIRDRIQGRLAAIARSSIGSGNSNGNGIGVALVEQTTASTASGTGTTKIEPTNNGVCGGGDDSPLGVLATEQREGVAGEASNAAAVVDDLPEAAPGLGRSTEESLAEVAAEDTAAAAMLGEAVGSEGTAVSPEVVSQAVASGDLGGVEDGGDRRGVETAAVVPESEALQGGGGGGDNGDTSADRSGDASEEEVVAAEVGQEVGVSPTVEGGTGNESIRAEVPQDNGTGVEVKEEVEVEGEGGDESEVPGVGSGAPLEADASLANGGAAVRAPDATISDAAIRAVGDVKVVDVSVPMGGVTGEFSEEYLGALESDDDDQEEQQADTDEGGTVVDMEKDANGEVVRGKREKQGGEDQHAGGGRQGETGEEGAECSAASVLHRGSVDIGNGPDLETGVEVVLVVETEGTRDPNVNVPENVPDSGRSGKLEDGSPGWGGLSDWKKEDGGIEAGGEEEDDEEVPSAEELTAKFLEVAVRTS